MGFELSAGIQLDDGRRLYAIFARSRRIMIVAHPWHAATWPGRARVGTAGRVPLAGDLLDELLDRAQR